MHALSIEKYGICICVLQMTFNSVGIVESLIQATLFYLFMDVELIMNILCGGIKFVIMTFLSWLDSPTVPRNLHRLGFEITLRHTTFLWTSDQPYAQTFTCQNTTLTRDRIVCLWWDSNLQFQQASSR